MTEEKLVIDYNPVSFKQNSINFVQQLPLFFKNYICGMLPIVQWISRYNLTWLVQDMIAGITVGIVIVPQSMAYAKIAGLDPQYGLYSSFAGVMAYCLFGTSKDISVGPISTVSLLVGTVIHSVLKVDPLATPAEIATTLGLFTGIIMIVISLLRLGILVDFIPEPAIAGYMTGSAITIALCQWPKLFGIPDVSTNNPPYLIFINLLSKLPHTRLDVAFGSTALIFLYGVRYLCGRLKFNSPKVQKGVFLFGIMRNGLIVIVGTVISFLICRGKTSSPISVIQSVPAGFDAMGVPHLNWRVVREAGGVLPSIVLILILEHISVAKSFGRIYDYQINPDQEILAIGICNAVVPFFGGYPSTGAFSRTAIMARSGSRTPLAGLFSGAVVLLALYVLTPAFQYIPDAILAAVVIHAVSDLASGRGYLKELWGASYSEFFVWVSAVLVTIFVNVQTGIYAAVGLSLMLMLHQFARPTMKTMKKVSAYLYVDDSDPNFSKCESLLPSSILIFRPCDSILYPNAEHISDFIVKTVKSRTHCGNIEDINRADSEKSWSAPRKNDNETEHAEVLKAVILDFSAVSRLDATASQILKTTRETLDKYAGHPVEWHFTNIQNQNVRFTLLHSGFGSLEADGKSLDSFDASEEDTSTIAGSTMLHTVETGSSQKEVITTLHNPGIHPRVPADRYTCFHWDIESAVHSVESRLPKYV